VHRLHRGDDAVAPEPREIGRVDDLRVFDAPATIALVGLRQILDGIQHGGIGLITDGVHRDLKPSIAARLIRLRNCVSDNWGSPRVPGASA
jgi:hypothetical protein